jgi:hypothetical protein
VSSATSAERNVLSGSLLIKLASCLVIVGSPAAYFATKSRDRPAALSPKQTTIEYRAEAASLRLAPGWTWRAAPVRSLAADGRGIMYEPGWGRQAADYYWYCSWTSRALDQRVGASDRRQALENVLSIRKKYYFTTALAPISRPAFDRVLSEAALGDLRGLRRDYEINCPKARVGDGSS